MIEMGKTYRTRAGREVRIYATDGEENKSDGPIHGAYRSKTGGWRTTSWFSDGAWQLGEKDDLDLVESDPHGILPRHRELLAEAYTGVGCLNPLEATGKPFGELSPWNQAALIALAKLDASRSNTEVG